VDFVVDEMMKLEHINAADSNAVQEGFARAPVVEDSFAVFVKFGKFNGVGNVVVARAVENGSGDVHAGSGRFGQAVSVNVEAEGS